jgi:hypothetical protein
MKSTLFQVKSVTSNHPTAVAIVGKDGKKQDKEIDPKIYDFIKNLKERIKSLVAEVKKILLSTRVMIQNANTFKDMWYKTSSEYQQIIKRLNETDSKTGLKRKNTKDGQKELQYLRGLIKKYEKDIQYINLRAQSKARQGYFTYFDPPFYSIIDSKSSVDKKYKNFIYRLHDFEQSKIQPLIQNIRKAKVALAKMQKIIAK